MELRTDGIFEAVKPYLAAIVSYVLRRAGFRLSNKVRLFPDLLLVSCFVFCDFA